MRLIRIVQAVLTAALGSVVGAGVLLAMAGFGVMFVCSIALAGLHAAGQLATDQVRARIR